MSILVLADLSNLSAFLKYSPPVFHLSFTFEVVFFLYDLISNNCSKLQMHKQTLRVTPEILEVPRGGGGGEEK